MKPAKGGVYPRPLCAWCSLVGGTGTGKTHLAIAIARACIRDGARGRFFNVVDLVNRLEAEGRAGRQGRIADTLSRIDFVVLDELGYLPFAQSGGQLLFHLISRLYERQSLIDSSISLDCGGEARRAVPPAPSPARGVRARASCHGDRLKRPAGGTFRPAPPRRQTRRGIW